MAWQDDDRHMPPEYHHEARGRLRPAWDGIVGWLLVLAGLVAVSAAAQHLPVNGADLVALLVTVAGLALVARRMGGPDR